ncbi:MAG: hypothetical protein IKD89_02845 [Clostridia bacterium]|nr:hypothetical protein [Clostridia bacterium]
MGLFGKYIDGAKKAGSEYVNKAGKASRQDASDANGYVLKQEFDLGTSIPKETKDNAALIKKPERPTGKAVTLELFGENIEVPAEMDVFNAYRKQFYLLARECTQKAAEKYGATVRDYVSFIEGFPGIYDEYLYPLIKYAMDTLFSENVFSVSAETLTAKHKARFRSAISDYETVVSAGNKAAEGNKNNLSTAILTMAADRYKTRNAGGAFGNLYGQIADGMVSGHKERIGVSKEQKEAMFAAVDAAELMLHVFSDYFFVHGTLVELLIENGVDIVLPGEAEIKSAENVFKNLTSAGFPEDKIKSAFVNVIRLNPYDMKYYKYAAKKFGRTDEIIALADYFGFADEI